MENHLIGKINMLNNNTYTKLFVVFIQTRCHASKFIEAYYWITISERVDSKADTTLGGQIFTKALTDIFSNEMLR